MGTRRRRLARWHAALFGVLWLATAAVPCAMAMPTPSDPAPMAEDCPHCPPEPCHERAPAPCDPPDLDARPSVDKSFSHALVAPAGALLPPDPRPLPTPAAPPGESHARDGPRPHLLNAQFNE